MKLPAFFISTVEDHIAPWKTTYKGAKHLGGEVRLVLGGSGHVAGIVNPQLQASKYFSSQQFQVFHLIEHRIEQKMLRTSAYKLT